MMVALMLAVLLPTARADLPETDRMLIGVEVLASCTVSEHAGEVQVQVSEGQFVRVERPQAAVASQRGFQTVHIDF